jgi:hypothetical protein
MDRSLPDRPPAWQERERAIIRAAYAEMDLLAQATTRRFDRIRDPFQLLALLRGWGTPVPANVARAGYRRFIRLAATWPAADVDILLAAARRLFKVRIRTMRSDLALARSQSKRAAS